DRLGQVVAVAPGEDVDRMAHRRQVPGDLADVDVLAPAVDAPEHRQGGRVLADQGDPAHGRPPAVRASPGATWAASGRVRPVPRANASSQSRANRSIWNLSSA